MNDKFNNAVGPQVRAPRAKAGKTIPVLTLFTLVTGIQCATQFFAHEFQYQSALGAHIHYLYAPWSILHWAGRWYAIYPHAFLRAGSIGITVTALGLLALLIARLVLANSVRSNPYLHGSARWANLKDIQVAGLLPRPRTLSEVITGKHQSCD